MGDDFTGRDYVGLYGNVRIRKGWCQECSGHAFIIRGELSCCGERYRDEPVGQKRECHPFERRYLPAKEMQEKILSEQNDQCFYCDRRFGAQVLVKKRRVRLRQEWDHMVPFSYAQNNHTDNFVASCHMCIRWKRSIMFDTIEAARIYLSLQWERKSDATSEASEPSAPRKTRVRVLRFGVR